MRTKREKTSFEILLEILEEKLRPPSGTFQIKPDIKKASTLVEVAATLIKERSFELGEIAQLRELLPKYWPSVAAALDNKYFTIGDRKELEILWVHLGDLVAKLNQGQTEPYSQRSN